MADITKGGMDDEVIIEDGGPGTEVPPLTITTPIEMPGAVFGLPHLKWAGHIESIVVTDKGSGQVRTFQNPTLLVMGTDEGRSLGVGALGRLIVFEPPGSMSHKTNGPTHIYSLANSGSINSVTVDSQTFEVHGAKATIRFATN